MTNLLQICHVRVNNLLMQFSKEIAKTFLVIVPFIAYRVISSTEETREEPSVIKAVGVYFVSARKVVRS